MVGVPVVVHLILRACAQAMELVVIWQVHGVGPGFYGIPDNVPVICLSQHSLRMMRGISGRAYTRAIPLNHRSLLVDLHVTGT